MRPAWTTVAICVAAQLGPVRVVVASCDAAAFEELVRPIFADDGEAL